MLISGRAHAVRRSAAHHSAARVGVLHLESLGLWLLPGRKLGKACDVGKRMLIKEKQQ